MCETVKVNYGFMQMSGVCAVNWGLHPFTEFYS